MTANTHRPTCLENAAGPVHHPSTAPVVRQGSSSCHGTRRTAQALSLFPATSVTTFSRNASDLNTRTRSAVASLSNAIVTAVLPAAARIVTVLLTLTAGTALPTDDLCLQADILIVGGTESGCAAAVQAARMGIERIVLVNDIDWLGGQFSAEALTAIDENRGPAGYDHTVPFPRNGLFREIVDRIERLNLRKYGRARPGNTRVITTCRPSDAECVFRDLVQPYVDTGQLTIVPHHVPVAARTEGTHLRSVTFASAQAPQQRLTVTADLTIDASDWGDVIRLSGAEYEFGPDLKAKYGEPLAPEHRDGYPRTDMNPITFCMVIEETDRWQPIPPPPGYDPRCYRTHPWPKDPLALYASRRLIDHYGFPDIDHPDVILLCFPAIDYPLDVLPQHVVESLEATEPGASRKNIVQMTPAQRQIIFDDARRYSLGFLHYLQTEVHDAMPDKTHSFRRFVLSEEFGTRDRMPFKPYVRESLRLQAQYMLKQQDTTGYGGNARSFAQIMFHDAVACWQFEYDFHPTKRVFSDNGDPAGPWHCGFRKGRTWGPPYSGRCQFPLRSLIPRTLDGLLGCQKNLGFSSIVSSAVRLHDQSVAIGAAAGAVAAVSLQRDVLPRDIWADRTLLNAVWEGLCSRVGGSVPQTLWPFADLDPDHPAFEAVNLLAVRGGLPVHPGRVNFRPDEPATTDWKKEAIRRTLSVKQADPVNLPDLHRNETRGVFAQRLWQAVRDLPDHPFPRMQPDDADADGICDRDDPLPFLADDSGWADFSPAAETDGHPDPLMPQDRKEVRQFSFCGSDVPPEPGFVADHGHVFDEERGFGWQRDLTAHARWRHQADGIHRDTFLFTRSHDIWNLRVAPGHYTVSVCIGDSAFDQNGQNVTVEGKNVFQNIDTAAGEWAESTVAVQVSDCLLTVEIGRTDSTSNTCLNWLRVARQMPR